MTISTEIQKIKTTIADSYIAASNKGASLPSNRSGDNLVATIASIPESGSVVTVINHTGSPITQYSKVWLNEISSGADYDYEAILYSNIDESVITGIANENALADGVFEATAALVSANSLQNLLYNETNNLSDIVYSTENQPQQTDAQILAESISELEDILGVQE